jgi:hypothetical protein
VKINLYFFLFLFLINSVFAEKLVFEKPLFPIYVSEIPVYGNLDAIFSFYPTRETAKLKQYNLNRKIKTEFQSNSSYISIKVDNEIFRINQLTQVETKWDLDKNSFHFTGVLEAKKIQISMSLNPSPNNKNGFNLSYSLQNYSGMKKEIGFRLFLDISTHSKEGGYIKVLSKTTGTIDSEIKFIPYETPYWETEIDPVQNWKLRNYLTGVNISPPDKAAVVNWEKGFESNWEYFTKKKNSILTDSALILWWEPKWIEVGKSLEVKTEFEIRKNIEGYRFDLLDANLGYGRMNLCQKNRSKQIIYLEYDFSIFPESFLLNKDYPSSFKINPNEVLDVSLPMTIYGKGKVDLILKETRDGVLKNFQIPISLSESNRSQSPPVIRSNKYPVVYITDKKGLQLKAKIKDKKNQTILAESNLTEKVNDRGTISYTAEIDLKDFNGEVEVEIYLE